MHIGIAGPIATADIAALLDTPATALPAGYVGAPFMSILIGALLARGHRVSAYTLSEDLPLRRDATVRAHGPGLTLHYVPARPRAWPFNGWRTGRVVDLFAFERGGLRRALRDSRPDVVHAHWAYEFAWAALDSGLPHLVTAHDSPFRVARFHRGLKLGGYRWLRALMAWQVLRRARQVSTVSPYMVDQIQPLCRVPVAMVPNPIGPQVFACRRQPAVGERRVVMVSSGSDPHKNVANGLRAFAALARQRPGLVLQVFGAGLGPDEATAHTWRLRAPAGSIQFLGAQPHHRVLRALSEAEVLLHPSLEESFGAVLAEALAIGVPVVAGRSSGAVPWVVGEAGCLVDVRQPAAIQAALAMLLDHAPRAARLGEQGRRRTLERFASDRVAEAYETLYQRCR